MWRVVFDDRTKIPLHELYAHYRMEDLEDIHAWLDGFDQMNEARDKKDEAKRRQEERKWR